MVALLPILLNYIRKNTAKWQGVVEAFALISGMARGAVIQGSRSEQILREYVESRLEDLMPIVATAVLDLNREVMYFQSQYGHLLLSLTPLQVSKQAKRALNSLLGLIHNPDLIPCIPVLSAFAVDPSDANLRKGIFTVSHTTFISSINSVDLAVLAPLLGRALSSRSATQDSLREALLIVENLPRLLQNPIQAQPFLKGLVRHVKNANERASSPEIQNTARRVLGMMEDCINPSQGQHHPNVTVCRELGLGSGQPTTVLEASRLHRALFGSNHEAREGLNGCRKSAEIFFPR